MWSCCTLGLRLTSNSVHGALCLRDLPPATTISCRAVGQPSYTVVHHHFTATHPISLPHSSIVHLPFNVIHFSRRTGQSRLFGRMEIVSQASLECPSQKCTKLLSVMLISTSGPQKFHLYEFLQGPLPAKFWSRGF